MYNDKILSRRAGYCMENAVIIRTTDSVVTVIEPILKGEVIDYPGCVNPIIALCDIPIYHKVAVVDVKKGADVFKYGEKIGIACEDIHAGEHVHVHNLRSVRA